ncbi:helix-turn-helix domain-containing protein [Breznakia pachnodae]|uniref:Transcriptional regulator with XRE-family HTH domain n=1 Tax=Breznakia pachnodae TaxID=265178 RepID=A0ABU0E6G2_9FIRM|nr:helix-turn-helix transcriptional regulator [Breznakia pachnodae]MDQ0362488.1 transcriptional regulator with XRE-family HTH domain [Breznakia pachnodae]
MRIKVNLKELRNKKTMSIYQLSKATGLNESIIRKIESGERANPSIRTVAKLCECLEISIDDFIYNDLAK